MCSTTCWQSVTLLALVSSDSLLGKNGAKIDAGLTWETSATSPGRSESSACHCTWVPALPGSSVIPAGWDQPWAFLVPVTASHLTKTSPKAALPLLRFHVTVLSCLLGGPVYLVRGCPGTLRLQLGHLSLAAVPVLDKLCIPSTEASNQAKILAWNSLTRELHDSSLQLRNSLFGQIGKAEMLGMWYLLD